MVEAEKQWLLSKWVERIMIRHTEPRALVG